MSEDADQANPLAMTDAAADGSRPLLPLDDAVRGPDGWVRVLLALAVGIIAGALIALLLPRDDGPRRALPQGTADARRADDPQPSVGTPPASTDEVSTTPDPGTTGAHGTDV